jgi:hypothetical protein
MSSEQNGNGSKRYITKPIAIMATVGVLVASLSALNTFTGLNFRPAWGYEIEQSMASDKETQALLATVIETQSEMNQLIIDLQQAQYELQIGMIDGEKWELRKELSDHRKHTKSYRNNSASVPEWLQILVSDTESKIKILDEERRKIVRKLEEYVSQLDEPTT